jgi:hypothetical protein
VTDPRDASEVRLEKTGTEIVGEVRLVLPPGIRSATQARAVDRVLAVPLTNLANELGVVLAAAPSAFAFAQPGKDERGRMRFVVRGIPEGGRLVPRRPDPAGDAGRNQ